jgi:hypothetical protein
MEKKVYICDPEVKRGYNKKYYESHKTKIAEKLYVKEECENCGRKVNHQNMNKHMKTKYCQTHTKRILVTRKQS